MSDKVFVDSNIWLYAFIESDSSSKSKRSTAVELIQIENICLSNQVINEVCVNLLRKSDIKESYLLDLIKSFYRRYEVVEQNMGILIQASELRQKYSLSFGTV